MRGQELPPPLPLYSGAGCHRPLRQGRRGGFTIVEVLIAISVLAALTAVTWMSITNVYRSRDLIEQRMARFQQVRGVFDRMSYEVTASYLAGPTLGSEDLPGEVDQKEIKTEAQALEANLEARREPFVTGMKGKRDRIDFTTMGHRQSQPNERVGYASEIGYFLRSERNDDGRLTHVLMRREDVTADRKIDHGGVIYPVLHDVESIEFFYWDPGPVKLGTYEEIAQGKWVRDWDTSRSQFSGRLPSRVRVKLTLPAQGPSRKSEVFTTQISIATTEVMEF